MYTWKANRCYYIYASKQIGAEHVLVLCLLSRKGQFGLSQLKDTCPRDFQESFYAI